jgi:hypothetical protein
LFYLESYQQVSLLLLLVAGSGGTAFLVDAKGALNLITMMWSGAFWLDSVVELVQVSCIHEIIISR